ncbi:TPA: hypothetical protein ACSTLY_003558 [Serratia fonticola]|jgi:hypothetical protein|uniref:hypothetical protein n=1 Tax=Serratia fonticola TaxID=47917 RepID=UPI002179488D|nr:hypothetical protein [Serratia fonticola]CAI0995484.1 Uncharacterised protein [Serratia fonticola]CAI1199782.1 Uncharacterised protein [Serratia fonticola]
MKNKMFMLMCLVGVVGLCVLYWGGAGRDMGKGFECRARVYTKLIANSCDKTTTMDVFLSLRGDGKGDVLVSGSYSCQNTSSEELESLVNFTYSREGAYYSIHFEPRDPAVSKLFNVLKDDNIKIKFTNVDDNDYIVSSPIETLMMCTAD